MPVTDDFNTESAAVPKGYNLYPYSDHVLQTRSNDSSGYAVMTTTFDFLNRLVVVIPSSGDNRTFTFSEFDDGSIEWHYHKMVELGKKPRPPAHLDGKPSLPRARSGLNA